MAKQSSYQRQYRKRQRQGKQDLRFLSLLLFLALLFYTAFSFYILTRLTNGDQALYMRFTFSVLGSLIMWGIILRMLWNYNKLGRLLYWLCLLISAYAYQDALWLRDVTWEPVLYRYLFIVLFGCKCLVLLYGGIRLLFSKTIRSIWSMNELFDHELADMEPQEEEALPEVSVSAQDRKIAAVLKRFSLLLGLCLYLSMLVIFMILGVMGNQLPDHQEGIRAIQYQLFSESLFSALLWSVPIVIMYMGRKWSPYLIYVGGSGEFIRLGLSYMQYIQLFQNTFIQTEIKVLFAVISCLRYLLLYVTCRSLLHHPLIRKLRLEKSQNNE